MSDEISAPDTDDEQKKTAHRQHLVQAARLSRTRQGEAIWEVVRPAFQSNEVFPVSGPGEPLTNYRSALT